MNVREGSKRLDRTLLSEAFTHQDTVSLIVRNHLLKSPPVDADHKSDVQDGTVGEKYLDAVTGYWSDKVWKFLEQLRSASGSHPSKPLTSEGNSGSTRDWNLKDESDRYRVMYREGPVGTPFHTLCIDGLVDGDVSSGMCVAWESPMFKEWWPQFVVPTFKIVESKWLRRVRVGEDLSLIRFKVPWPLAQREVLMSAFEMEYFEEDLIIGLVDSVPEDTEINERILGFSGKDLPAPSSDVRIEIAGGFAMQRISKEKFIFRTIMNMDLKLDFVPPWVINFVSRQLAGQGLKLYQKAVLAVSNGTGNGKAFQKLLKTGHLYERIRSGLEMKTEDRGQTALLPIGRLPTFKDSVKSKTLPGSIRRMGNSDNNRVVPYPDKVDEAAEKFLGESSISWAEHVQSPKLPLVEGKSDEEISPDIAESSNQVLPRQLSKSEAPHNEKERREYEDPEVEWAITVLNKIIAFTQSCAALPGRVSIGELENRCIQNSKLDLNESDAKNHRKLPLLPTSQSPPTEVNKEFSTPNDTQKLDIPDQSRSSGLQIPESCGTSGVFSTSEIEVADTQDDTNIHHVGVSGSVLSEPLVEVPKVGRKGRRRRWRWICFSPNRSRDMDSGKVKLFSDDTVVKDFEISSRRHGNVLTGNSSRFINDRGYATDVDERFTGYGLKSRDSSPGKNTTLGQLLDRRD